MKVKVFKVIEYGLLVEGINNRKEFGLVHERELRTILNKKADEYSVGDELDVVLSCERNGRKQYNPVVPFDLDAAIKSLNNNKERTTPKTWTKKRGN